MALERARFAAMIGVPDTSAFAIAILRLIARIKVPKFGNKGALSKIKCVSGLHMIEAIFENQANLLGIISAFIQCVSL